MKVTIQFLQAGLLAGLATTTLLGAPTYPVVATGQTKCYDNSFKSTQPATR
jgi:hypothetical protein